MVNKVQVNTKKVRFPVSDDLYGLFFEDINRAGDGGVYPEMIRNRSFEDSLIPGGCTVDEDQLVYINRGGWPGCFNHGEGMDDWAAKVPYTPIPGWYTKGAEMTLCQDDTLNAKREASLAVKYEENGCIYNIGYAGVPVKPGEQYNLIVFLKADADFTLTAALGGENGEIYASEKACVKASDEWTRVDLSLIPKGEDYKGRVLLCADKKVNVLFGYTSLLPEKTYKGHGLRYDVVKALADTHPKFLRFPGGCIVEGFSLETAMRFSNTIGPAWERPSHNLMWHYRTTNGFGYHEFLQLCEDTGMEAMYVCNVGMSCQARVEELFTDEVVDEFLQEALNALEYALGPVTSKYGAMRAAAGHPEPFTMKYFEIGNENRGPAYNVRYEKFYNALKAAYPDVIYISNAHTERDGLPTEFADEHYYNTPEYFMENDTRFDSYDRTGPKIFLGEYAVNGGNTIASWECALAESVFLAGVERNQDIIRLAAYAPLLQNSDYTAWKPNLVVFDNHRVYGIPTYHAIKLMAQNRGKEVVEVETSGDRKPPLYKGIPGIMAEEAGMQFKNARVNGKPVSISQAIYGGYEEKDGITTLVQADNPHPFVGKNETWNRTFAEFMKGRFRFGRKSDNDRMWVVFGDQDLEEYTFEIDVKFDPENAMTLSVWNFHPETDAGCNEPKDIRWNTRNVRRQIWNISAGEGTTELPRFFMDEAPAEKTPLTIDYSRFNTYKIVCDHFGYKCYINDVLVQEKVHNLHDTVYAVATQDEDTVILKLIHAGDDEKDVEISLDCDVAKDVEISTLTAAMDAVNSFENPENVSAKTCVQSIGARTFTFRTPANSVNVLKLKKL